jgi:hypothetical protein
MLAPGAMAIAQGVRDRMRIDRDKPRQPTPINPVIGPLLIDASHIVADITMIAGIFQHAPWASRNLEQFVEQELATGKYVTRNELMVEVGRLYRKSERRLDELRQELLPALQRPDRGGSME